MISTCACLLLTDGRILTDSTMFVDPFVLGPFEISCVRQLMRCRSDEQKLERISPVFIGDMSVDDEFCSVCLLRSIVIDVYQNNTSNENASSPPQAASALRMAQQISKFSSNFVFREQQDPSEFLIALLNSLMRCLSSNESGSNTTYMSNPFRFLIGMNILSSVQCDVCSAHSKKETYESIWSIAIASCSSLRRALAGFCAEERLSGDNSFNCSKCQRRVKARRSCSLSDVSPILFIHLKRFVYDLNTGRTSKLKHFVSYPALLDLSPFMEEKDDRRKDQMREEKRTRYQLYAVLVHSGETTENGHIFSYVQCPDKLWYEADDELMTCVRSDVVFNDRNSYILCYSKESTVTDSRSASTQNELRNRSSKFYTSTPERHTQRAVSSFDRCSPVGSVTFLTTVMMTIIPIDLIYWGRGNSSLRNTCCQSDVKRKLPNVEHLPNRYVLRRSRCDRIHRNIYSSNR